MTVPTQTALEVPQTGLGQALGLGIQKGSELGLQAALKNFANTKDQQLTAFQKISTQQREDERKRKIESSVLNAVTSLADPRKGGDIDGKNIAPITADVTKLINQGVQPLEALNQGINNFLVQQDSLGLKSTVKGTVDLPNFKAKNIENLKKETVNKLKDNEITNPTLINRALKAKGWSTKDRQDIVKRVKGINQQQAEKVKVKFNPQNPEHIKRRDAILKKAKKNRKLAKQLLDREFIE